MNENDIFWLETQGYSYDPIGFITDSEGNFVKSVTDGEKTLYSAFDEIDFESNKQRQKELNELGFVANTDIDVPVVQQEEEFLFNYKVKQHLKNPDSIPLDLNNSLNKYRYDKIIEETNLKLKIKKEKDSITLVKRNKLKEIQFKKRMENFKNTGLIIVLVLLIVLTIKRILK